MLADAHHGEQKPPPTRELRSIRGSSDQLVGPVGRGRPLKTNGLMRPPSAVDAARLSRWSGAFAARTEAPRTIEMRSGTNHGALALFVRSTVAQARAAASELVVHGHP